MIKIIQSVICTPIVSEKNNNESNNYLLSITKYQLNLRIPQS